MTDIKKMIDQINNNNNNYYYSPDEVDFIKTSDIVNNNRLQLSSDKPTIPFTTKSHPNRGTIFGDCELKQSTCEKNSFPTIERLPIFSDNGRKKLDRTHDKDPRSKFIRAATLARFLGHNYSTKLADNDTNKMNENTEMNKDSKHKKSSKHRTHKSKRYSDRFHKSTGETTDLTVGLDINDNDRESAWVSISKGLGRLLWRKTNSINISVPDPEFKVCYLGNVLTGWAKGDSCVEKPLATLWRNYQQHHKPDVMMRVRVCPSGLKATTRQHGLTEYWSHRITHCAAPKNYPRLFCWIYRHEGRKLKHELRCHAVLCTKESIAQDMCKNLKDNLSRALKDFKRDKINRQNARLSLVNSVYENPSMPRRKILLSVGGNNYRPPLERSKSAPKLVAIEEVIGEEDDENGEEDETPKRSCCQIDPLYPAMTLGRRRCRRGHSLRRSSNRRRVQFERSEVVLEEQIETHPDSHRLSKLTSSTDSIDDFDKVLQCNDYNTESPLIGELMSYYDNMNLNEKTISLSDLTFEDDHLTKRFNGRALSLDNLDAYSDCDDGETITTIDDSNAVFFSQQSILDELTSESRTATIKRCPETKRVTDRFHDDEEQPGEPSSLSLNDSDEGSISSGCETASTVTNNLDDTQSKSDDTGNCQRNLDCGSISESTPQTFRHRLAKSVSQSKSTHIADDSDSEFSDESGFVENYRQNNRQSKHRESQLI